MGRVVLTRIFVCMVAVDTDSIASQEIAPADSEDLSMTRALYSKPRP